MIRCACSRWLFLGQRAGARHAVNAAAFVRACRLVYATRRQSPATSSPTRLSRSRLRARNADASTGYGCFQFLGFMRAGLNIAQACKPAIRLCSNEAHARAADLAGICCELIADGPQAESRRRCSRKPVNVGRGRLGWKLSSDSPGFSETELAAHDLLQRAGLAHLPVTSRPVPGGTVVLTPSCRVGSRADALAATDGEQSAWMRLLRGSGDDTRGLDLSRATPLAGRGIRRLGKASLPYLGAASTGRASGAAVRRNAQCRAGQQVVPRGDYDFHSPRR